MNYLIQVVISGLFIGSLYALLSVGFSLTWGVIGVLNISQAVFGILGAYIAYWFCHQTGLDALFSLPVIFPMLFIVGMFIYKLLIQRLIGVKGIYGSGSMVLTFGLTMIIENAMAWGWGPDQRMIPATFSNSPITEGITIPPSYIVGFALSILCIVLIHLFMQRTYMGKAVQATWQDPVAARLTGINTNWVSMITFGIAIGSAGIAGVALSLVYAFYPSLWLNWLVFVFMITILGGVGSIKGAAVGGLIIGLLVSVGGAFIPYTWVNLLLFGLLIVILLLKPAGLFRT